MRPDKPQFWTGGDVNLAMTEIIRPDRWEPIKNLTAKTLVDVHIDSREMMQGALKVIQDGIVTDVITTPVQKNTFVAPSQSLTFETLEVPIGNFSFSRKALTIYSGWDINLTDMMFNNDGTNLYILGNANDNIWTHNLSTPFDISTAIVKNGFSVTPQTTSPVSMMFNNNGMKLFVLGITNNNVFEYNLSTPFNISTATATFSRIALNVTPQTTSPVSMMFNNNGMKLFVLGDTKIFEYNLSTPFDISTATFSRIALNVTTQDTNPVSMMFNNNGMKLFVLGATNNNVFEYNLSTPFDISTATFSRIVVGVISQTAYPSSIMFNNNETKLFVLENHSNINHNNNIFEYLTPTIWTGNVKIRTINN